MSGKANAFFLFFLFILISCNSGDRKIKPALESITADNIKKHISMLASDDFLGRAPATQGEVKTIKYLAEEFKRIGLKPANVDSYFQEVPLMKLTPDPSMKLEIKREEQKFSFRFPDEFIAGTPQTSEQINLDNSEIVFVGYGINSPENKWNDYDGFNAKGKTVLMLVNDPGYATRNPDLFTGKAMTIYGRWTYKFEEAARQGAQAAIIIHETGAAGYPWSIIQNSGTSPTFYLVGNELTKSDLQVNAWVSTESARKLFESAGLDYDKVTASASKRGFKPVNMNLKASIHFKNQGAYLKSNNVAAVWPGTDQSGEYIIYTAHWDHFGVNNTFKGDTILNGAVDNATGTGALLEIAEAFTKLSERQNRSVLFLAVTCEEQGLLGSRYYAENPIFPLNKTVAVINMDALNILGKTKDMTIVGFGNSELDDYAVEVLKKNGRYADPDPVPEKGGYFRSDHFSFARMGVPSLYLSKGVDYIEHGKEWGLAESEKWTTTNYHKPTDNYEPEIWNFDGMIEDIKVYFQTGYDLSITKQFPNWRHGVPFKTIRDKMMGK